MRLRQAAAAKLLALVAIGAVPLVLHLALLRSAAFDAAGLGLVGDGLVALAATPHTLANLTGLAVFATSLLPGREPVCAALARRLHGPISSGMAGYARRVTQLWSGFFAAQLATSLALFLMAPLEVWSFFVNVLNLPLVATLYAAEYAYRRRYWAEAPPHSLADLARLVGLVRATLSKPAS